MEQILYIRNKDRKKIKEEYLTNHRGILLSEYIGPIAYAMRRGVPLYDNKGNLVFKPNSPKAEGYIHEQAVKIIKQSVIETYEDLAEADIFAIGLVQKLKKAGIL